MLRLLRRFLIASLLIAAIFSLTSCNFVLRKISGTLPANGDVSDSLTFNLSPNGLYVIYIADPNTDDKFELFITAIHGLSNPRRLTPATSLAPTINQFDFTPDSTHVVYKAAQDDASKIELFSVPVLGGTPVKLNAPLAGPQIYQFVIHPDWPYRVIYSADQDTLNQTELYSVELDGTDRKKLNVTMPTTSDIRRFQASNNNNRVVYLVGDSPVIYHDLYSVFVGGTGNVKLNGDPPEFCNVEDFKITGDGHYVVYKADQDIDGVFELYSVPTTGSSSPVKLNPDLPSGRSVDQFQITSLWVAYTADQDTNDVKELYVVPITGGSSLKINDTLPAGGNVQSFLLTPIRYVLYLADQETNDVFELYAVRYSPSFTRYDLSETPVSGGDVMDNYSISPDDQKVVFRGDLLTDGVYELFSVPSEGGTMRKLSGTLVSGGNVNNFTISPDSRVVVYKADKLTDGVFEIFGVAIDGSIAYSGPLNGTMTSGGNVDWFFFNTNGDAVVYNADQEIDEKWELYSFFDEKLLYMPVIMH